MKRVRGKALVDALFVGLMILGVGGIILNIWRPIFPSTEQQPTTEAVCAADDALPKDYVTTLAMRTWTVQNPEPDMVQESKPDPVEVSTEMPNANPMDKLAIAWLIAKAKKPLMGFGAAVGLFLLFRFFRGTHLLCWWRHKKRYGQEIWKDGNNRDKPYILWVCSRCSKAGRQYLGAGIWKIEGGKPVKDKDAYLRGEQQVYCYLQCGKKTVINPNED